MASELSLNAMVTLLNRRLRSAAAPEGSPFLAP